MKPTIFIDKLICSKQENFALEIQGEYFVSNAHDIDIQIEMAANVVKLLHFPYEIRVFSFECLEKKCLVCRHNGKSIKVCKEI